MERAVNMAKKAAETASTVLLLGESGTGKEMFAHAIHHSSERAHQPFVKVNCAAIPSELVEAELFGFEEGSFTGAKKGGKAGKFEQAHKGTIFLDEIGDMPLAAQVKLLGVLQDREVHPVGGNQAIPVDVRVIAATNQDLVSLIEKGEFREDLYYRLHVMPIEIPSLKERSADIRKIADQLLRKITHHLGKDVTHISDETYYLLEKHNWPGNVRELENVIERAVNLADSDTIEPEHLPYPMQSVSGASEKKQGSLKSILAETEKKLVMEALRETNDNKLEAASRLGISRSSLYDRLEKYGLIE
jgi:transcriptional regulator with PAS, ATPase and Fis domain